MSDFEQCARAVGPSVIPARWVLPIWPVQAPPGVNEGLWSEIQRRAHAYVCASIPGEAQAPWRQFALAAFAASQPRNTQRVPDRLGAIHVLLYSSGASLNERVDQVLSKQRLQLLLMSEHVTRLTPSSRQHTSRALTAMHKALLGEPRSCPPRLLDHPPHLIDSIRALAARSSSIQPSAQRVLRWLENDNPTARIPRIEAKRLCRYLASQGTRTTFDNLKCARLVELALRPIPAVHLLRGKPGLKGFAQALSERNPTFDLRRLRLRTEQGSELKTSSEAS